MTIYYLWNLLVTLWTYIQSFCTFYRGCFDIKIVREIVFLAYRLIIAFHMCSSLIQERAVMELLNMCQMCTCLTRAYIYIICMYIYICERYYTIFSSKLGKQIAQHSRMCCKGVIYLWSSRCPIICLYIPITPIFA